MQLYQNRLKSLEQKNTTAVVHVTDFKEIKSSNLYVNDVGMK